MIEKLNVVKTFIKNNYITALFGCKKFNDAVVFYTVIFFAGGNVFPIFNACGILFQPIHRRNIACFLH